MMTPHSRRRRKCCAKDVQQLMHCWYFLFIFRRSDDGKDFWVRWDQQHTMLRYLFVSGYPALLADRWSCDTVSVCDGDHAITCLILGEGTTRVMPAVPGAACWFVCLFVCKFVFSCKCDSATPGFGRATAHEDSKQRMAVV